MNSILPQFMNSLESQNAIFLGNKVFTDEELRCRPYWIRRALNPMTDIFVRREDTQTMELRIANIPRS